MKSIKILSPTLALMMVLVSPVTTLAISSNAEAKKIAVEDKQSDKLSLEERKVTLLREKAGTEIERRTTALTKLSAKIDLLKRLNESQKTNLKEQISNNQTELAQLKTKIESENDLTVLREDVKSITESYRIFAVFMPKINLLSSLEISSIMAEKLDLLSTKIGNIIIDLDTDGKDTSSIKSTLLEMQEEIKNAKTQIAATETEVLALDPSGYPANKDSMKDARNSLTEIRKNLNAARVNAVQMIADIKKLRTETDSTLKGSDAGQTNKKTTGETTEPQTEN